MEDAIIVAGAIASAALLISVTVFKVAKATGVHFADAESGGTRATQGAEPELRHLMELRDALKDPNPADWIQLPDPKRQEWRLKVGYASYRNGPDLEINLADYSRECKDWKERHSLAPPRTIGRCCQHLARAILKEDSLFELLADWSRVILKAVDSYGPPPQFVAQTFSNGADDFLGLYDVKRGYMQLYGPKLSEHPFQFGYDISQNRWAGGVAPERPLVLKKEFRTWIKAMDIAFGNK